MTEEVAARLKKLEEEFRLLQSRLNSAREELFFLRSEFEGKKQIAALRESALRATPAATTGPENVVEPSASRAEPAEVSAPISTRELPAVPVAGTVATPPPLPMQAPILAAISPPSPATVADADTAAAQFKESSGDLPESETASSSFEMRFGMVWAVRLGVLALLTGLVFLSGYTYENVIRFWPNVARAALLYVFALGLFGVGFWLERGRESLRNFSRVLMAGGAGAVYYLTYASHHVEELRWMDSAAVCVTLLVSIAGGMVWLAERRRSPLLGTASVALAYFSVMVGQQGWASPLAHLVLAGAALALMLRNNWQALPYIALVGTYLGYGFWRGQAAADFAGWQLVYLWGYWLVFLIAAIAPGGERLSARQRSLLIVANTLAAVFFAGWSGADDDVVWLPLMVSGALSGLSVRVSSRLGRGLSTERTLLTQAVVLFLVGAAIKLSGAGLLVLLGVMTVLLRYGARLSRYGLVLGALSLLTGFYAVAVGWEPAFCFGCSVQQRWPEFWMRVILGALFLGAANWRLPHPEYRFQWGTLGMGIFSAVMFVCAGFWYLRPESAAVFWALAGTAMLIFSHRRRAQELLFPALLPVAFSLCYSLPLDFLHERGLSWWSMISLGSVWLFNMYYWRCDEVGGFSKGLRAVFSNSSAVVFVVWSWLQLLLGDVELEWALTGPVMALGFLLLGGVTRHGVLALGGQLHALTGLAVFLLGDAGMRELLVSGGCFLAMSPVAAWCAGRLQSGFERLALRVLRYVPIVAGLQVLYFGYLRVDELYLPLVYALGTLVLAASCLWKRGVARAVLSLVYGVFSVLAFAGIAGTSDAREIFHVAVWAALLATPYVMKASGTFAKGTGLFVGLWSATQVGVLMWLGALSENVNLVLLWAGWGFLMMLLGIFTRERCQRLWGLGFLLLALLRVFFYDAWQLPKFERILALMGLGVVLIALGYVYNRFQDQLKKLL